MDKLTEVFKDQDFVKELVTKKTPEEAQEAFKTKGIDLTIEEVKAIGAKLSGKDTELSENDLSSVAGGCIPSGYNVEDWLIKEDELNHPCRPKHEDPPTWTW